MFTNDSNISQAPIWIPLAVTLDRLGAKSNGASLSRTTKTWGVGAGTLDLSTAGVMIALSDLSVEYIK